MRAHHDRIVLLIYFSRICQNQSGLLIEVGRKISLLSNDLSSFRLLLWFFFFLKVEIKYRLSMGEQRVGSEWTETSLVCPNSPFFCPRPFFSFFLSLFSLHKHPFPSNWFCGFWRPCMYVHITISNIYRELLARARAPAPHSSSLLKPMLYFSTSFNARLFWSLCLLVLVNSVSCRIHTYCNVAHFSCREKPSGVW